MIQVGCADQGVRLSIYQPSVHHGKLGIPFLNDHLRRIEIRTKGEHRKLRNVFFDDNAVYHVWLILVFFRAIQVVYFFKIRLKPAICGNRKHAVLKRPAAALFQQVMRHHFFLRDLCRNSMNGNRLSRRFAIVPSCFNRYRDLGVVQLR
ncbi:hypothetical protein SDC9_161596 [bioreactor metagenome]|uniref:Uncharacterized protein n=1 Tax=bioreactor metagenome TaxID=1076179 RepID=A0A645FJX9_9ZZZZ